MQTATSPRIGLALGSGGARGWAHIGVIRALAELGVRPSVVAGCSMGAIVGAACAADRLDALEDWARSLTATNVLTRIDMRFSRGGLIEGQEIARLLKGLRLPKMIEALEMAFGTVATDLETGEELWFRSGDLLTAVRGSLSIPGVFNPYPHEDKWLLDGALTDPVPVALARALGADVVIAVDPNATVGRPLWDPVAPDTASQTLLARVAETGMVPEMLRSLVMGEAPARRAPNYFDVVGTAIDIMQIKILQARLRTDPPELLLETDLKHVGILELHRADEAIRQGFEIAMDNAEALKALTLASPAPG